MHGERETIQIRINKVLKPVANLDAFCKIYLMGSPSSNALTAASTESFTICNHRFRHILSSSLSTLRKIVDNPECLPLTAEKDNCKDCLLDKLPKLPTTSAGSKTYALLELIHSYHSGKFSVLIRGGFQYYVTFIDAFFHYATFT